ncbi:hypothetical protein NQZ68_019724, partial [Dissostichus eleginoides]
TDATSVVVYSSVFSGLPEDSRCNKALRVNTDLAETKKKDMRLEARSGRKVTKGFIILDWWKMH